MRLYTRIVDRGSFTLAAQDLEVPRSTATQVIKELETRLGVRLLQRTTRSVRSTLDGEAYYQRCVAILGEIEDAESAFRDAKPRGLLRVDVHGTLARHFVLPALPAFLAEYPDLQLQMSEGDRLVDLVREGIDCVLRVGDLQDGAMIGRRVAMLSEVTCASPAYLARHGVPATLADLDGHVVVAFMSSATGTALPLEFTVEGVLRNCVLPAIVTVAAAESYVAAARLGLGLIQVPHYHVAADLAAGSLIEILSQHRPSSTPVSLLYPHRRQLSLRVRVFIDWLAREFAKHPEVSITAG
jgi:DNA-binding transcriptional LysR family regulator